MRLHQELVLGVGGVRALRALGIDPAVWHLNEGHSAFLLAERAREFVATGVELETAWERVRRDSVFTIHTPVSAGNERFAADLVRQVAGPLLDGDGRPQTGGVPIDAVLELGLGADGDRSAVRHDRVLAPPDQRRQRGQPAPRRDRRRDVDAASRPTRSGAITNGIHVPSWMGNAMGETLRRELDADLDDLDEESEVGPFWEHLADIPTAELWDAHQREKLELAIFARRRLRSQFARHGEAPAVLDALETALDPDILTIGFARRFATYKRAGLLFTDLERLAAILWNEERPVQVVFAGKAHPADRPGQQVIQEIFGRSRSERLRGRVFILEDYDMRIGRYLVAGVDVWLNNPRRPLEASGTSGMKAAMNGAVNVSVLDGWWDEGFVGDNGWAIGGREQNPDEGAQDWSDAQDLYRLLEDEIVPRYYERDARRPAGAVGRPDAALDGLDAVAVLDDPDAPRLRREDVPARRPRRPARPRRPRPARRPSAGDVSRAAIVANQGG